jgi:hypothetical protein
MRPGLWACLYRRRDSNPDDPDPASEDVAAARTNVEDALAFGLREAAGAAQWAIVAQLARELEARRTNGGAT